MKIRRDNFKRLIRISRNGDIRQTETGKQTEAEMQEMKQDKDEQKHTRYSLKKIQPISFVAVIQDIASRFRRDKNPVNGMIQKRQKNAENLYEQQKRQMMYVGDRFIKDLIAVHRLGVREHMGEKEKSERNDAGQLV